MMRRAKNFGADAKLNRMFKNMCAEYKYNIRLDDLANLADLTDRATEFEEIRREEAKGKQAARKSVSAAKTSEDYDRANTCWRCKGATIALTAVARPNGSARSAERTESHPGLPSPSSTPAPRKIYAAPTRNDPPAGPPRVRPIGHRLGDLDHQCRDGSAGL